MGLKDAGPNQDGLEMDPVRSAARKVLLGKDEDWRKPIRMEDNFQK